MFFHVQHLGSMMGILCQLSRGPGLGIVRRGSTLQEWTVLTAPSPSPPVHRRSPPQPVKSPTLAAHGVQEGNSAQLYHRTTLQDEARGNGQVLWQIYLAAAPNVSPLQRSVSGALMLRLYLLIFCRQDFLAALTASGGCIRAARGFIFVRKHVPSMPHARATHAALRNALHTVRSIPVWPERVTSAQRPAQHLQGHSPCHCSKPPSRC